LAGCCWPSSNCQHSHTRLTGPGLILTAVRQQLHVQFVQLLTAEWNHEVTAGIADQSSTLPLPKLSTTRDLVDSQQVRIIHPFHRLRSVFRFVVSKKLWGEDRVTIQLADGSPLSVLSVGRMRFLRMLRECRRWSISVSRGRLDGFSRLMALRQRR